jgi:hypothetical protein
MDRPRSHRCAPSRGILGIYCFRHQRPDSAIVGENYGRRRPVAYVPWQRRLECPGFVYCGAGTLLCWDRCRNPKFVSTTEAQNDAQYAGEVKPNSSTVCGSGAAPGSTVLTSGCRAGSSGCVNTSTRGRGGSSARSNACYPHRGASAGNGITG